MGESNLLDLSKDLFQGFHIDGDLLIALILNGDIPGMLQLFWDALLHSVTQPVIQIRQVLITLFMIGIGALLLKYIAKLFQDSQIQTVGFWIVYLILVTQLLYLFYNGKGIVVSAIEEMIQFGNIFIPSFAVALTAAAGSITSSGYVSTLMFAIYLIQNVLLLVVAPMIEAYMFLVILGILWEQERVEYLLKMLESLISFIFKTLMATLTGIGLLQSMILPFVDGLKIGTAKSVVSLIPGVGEVADSTLELVTGAAIVLKNGLGIVGILLLILLVAGPMFQILVLSVVVKLAAVGVGMMGDKAMTYCMDKVGTACFYLVKLIGVSTLLFLLWITIAIYTTNQRLIF